eukprot:scaffold273_cov242-Pinguiococcus_pyrenoidosus.AAC.22
MHKEGDVPLRPEPTGPGRAAREVPVQRTLPSWRSMMMVMYGKVTGCPSKLWRKSFWKLFLPPTWT